MVKFFNTFFEVIGWIKISLSPIFISLIIAAFIMWNNSSTINTIISIVIVAAGVIIGIKWATKIYHTKRGTMQYLSQTNSSPTNGLDN